MLDGRQIFIHNAVINILWQIFYNKQRLTRLPTMHTHNWSFRILKSFTPKIVLKKLPRNNLHPNNNLDAMFNRSWIKPWTKTITQHWHEVLNTNFNTICRNIEWLSFKTFLSYSLIYIKCCFFAINIVDISSKMTSVHSFVILSDSS